MILFFILIFLFFAIITAKFKIEVKNFYFNSQTKRNIKRTYEIKTTLKIFYIIPIFEIKINNKKIKKVLEKTKIKNKIEEEKTKFLKDQPKIDKETLKSMKKFQIQIDEMDLQISVGTENASITAFIIPTISTILAIFLNNKVEKYNDKQKFKIIPIYINQNLINIEFSGIFQIKMIHIINAICILKKKRKGDKNERTSHRRSYDYSYE